MIPKSGYRFSEKIMLQQKAEEECHIGRVSDRAAEGEWDQLRAG